MTSRGSSLSKSRRTWLTLAGIGLGYAALRTLVTNWPQALEDEPLVQPAGFRRIVTGDSSVRLDPLIGIGTAASAEQQARAAALREDVLRAPCLALYRDPAPGPDRVPMASFSDYFCPFCRAQTEQVAALVAARPSDISVTWHELPLLGESSDLAARVALAAERQGAYVAAHGLLMRSRARASGAYLEDLASRLEIDAIRLRRDMDSEAVTLALATSRALSQVFRFVGTPALVVGRTVVQGRVSERMLLRIIEREREEGWGAVCRDASRSG